MSISRFSQFSVVAAAAILWPLGNLTAGFAMAAAPPADANAPPTDVQDGARASADTAVGGSDKTSSDTEKRKSARFIRIRRDEGKQPLALETAIVHFSNPQGDHPDLQVDLVGVVHIGDKSYFRQLNERFSKYDAVLYELVAEKGRNVPQPGRARKSAHPVGMLQMGMKNMLELEFQLDVIDYSKPNMVHADMSPTEFAQTMQDRGESFLELFFRMMGQGMAQQANNPSQNTDLKILGALFSKNRARQLKMVMAQQFEAMDGSMPALDGPDGSTIVTERNKRAFEVLREQIKAGKKRIAVFYGAGHLADMQRRLEADFGLRRRGEEWMTAWTLDDSSKPSKPSKPETPAGSK